MKAGKKAALCAAVLQDSPYKRTVFLSTCSYQVLGSVLPCSYDTVNATKDRPKLIAPTDEEDAAINRGIAQDPDNPEITEEQFKRMRPWSELKAEIDAKRKEAKQLVSIR